MTIYLSLPRIGTLEAAPAAGADEASGGTGMDSAASAQPAPLLHPLGAMLLGCMGISIPHQTHTRPAAGREIHCHSFARSAVLDWFGDARVQARRQVGACRGFAATPRGLGCRHTLDGRSIAELRPARVGVGLGKPLYGADFRVAIQVEGTVKESELPEIALAWSSDGEHFTRWHGLGRVCAGECAWMSQCDWCGNGGQPPRSRDTAWVSDRAAPRQLFLNANAELRVSQELVQEAFSYTNRLRYRYSTDPATCVACLREQAPRLLRRAPYMRFVRLRIDMPSAATCVLRSCALEVQHLA